MDSKRRVAIFFGGKSAEHEISLISGMNIVKALDHDKWEPVLIGINKQGRWFLQEETKVLQQSDDPKQVKLSSEEQQIAVLPGEGGARFYLPGEGKTLEPVEVAFAILHGPNGEDGSMQGLFEQLDLPYVGPGVLGSAASMDKEVAKRLLRDHGIPNSNFVAFRVEDRASISFDEVSKQLGMPVFIKPANMGSSVGISRAHDRESFEKAVDLAFVFDRKIVIEEEIRGRELEIAVLGNEVPAGTLPGEVVPEGGGWYSYEAKYIDASGARLFVPAAGLDEEIIARMKEMAVRTFKALDCEGLSRVDFFLREDGELMINEVNTLPGFTKISMYPQLWDKEGIGYSELIDRLLELAIDRHAARKALKTDRV